MERDYFMLMGILAAAHISKHGTPPGGVEVMRIADCAETLFKETLARQRKLRELEMAAAPETRR